MSFLILAPLGFDSCLIFRSWGTGINVDRTSEVAPVNVFWDDVSQKKGAGIRD